VECPVALHTHTTTSNINSSCWPRKPEQEVESLIQALTMAFLSLILPERVALVTGTFLVVLLAKRGYFIYKRYIANPPNPQATAETLESEGANIAALETMLPSLSTTSRPEGATTPAAFVSTPTLRPKSCLMTK